MFIVEQIYVIRWHRHSWNSLLLYNIRKYTALLLWKKTKKHKQPNPNTSLEICSVLLMFEPKH